MDGSARVGKSVECQGETPFHHQDLTKERRNSGTNCGGMHLIVIGLARFKARNIRYTCRKTRI
ncbi:hypothetical protein NQ317_010716 [Molorchus minor]|uniref:Uncharacterized protein n=1 Tax=Molorchus minor TaxID=1323400 RepID=A0ABQ9K8K0_9CUCU|nr:hypothetical protein NQ317_010716 [Molorchus minor]